MLKQLPEPVAANLIPPDLDRAYFDGCSTFPFSARADGCNFHNAWWLAEASFAAYDDFDATGHGRVNLNALAQARYRVSSATSGNTQFLAIENDAVLIIAFRGTRVEGFSVPVLQTAPRVFSPNWGDVVTDAKFLPCKLSDGSFVHAGFLDAFEDVHTAVTGLINAAARQGRAIWLCGHSLGAAIATIAAYFNRATVQALYTFGSPRVGDGVFAEALLARVPNIYRFVHHRDVVTTVPPQGLPLGGGIAQWLPILGPLAGGEHGGYTHVGNAQYISGGKSSTIAEGEQALDRVGALAQFSFAHALESADALARGLATMNPDRWPLPFEVIADHAPVYYANKIFNSFN